MVRIPMGFHRSLWKFVFDQRKCIEILWIIGPLETSNLACVFFKIILRIYAWSSRCEISPIECHRTPSIISQLWLTHWGRVTHICVSNLTIIGSDNGLSPGRRQAIIWTNVGILLIGPLGTNLSDIWIGIQTFSVKKIHLKMSSGKCRPFFSASMC